MCSKKRIWKTEIKFYRNKICRDGSKISMTRGFAIHTAYLHSFTFPSSLRHPLFGETGVPRRNIRSKSLEALRYVVDDSAKLSFYPCSVYTTTEPGCVAQTVCRHFRNKLSPSKKHLHLRKITAGKGSFVAILFAPHTHHTVVESVKH